MQHTTKENLVLFVLSLIVFVGIVALNDSEAITTQADQVVTTDPITTEVRVSVSSGLFVWIDYFATKIFVFSFIIGLGVLLYRSLGTLKSRYENRDNDFL